MGRTHVIAVLIAAASLGCGAITRHETGSIIDLKPGSDRGTQTIPLLRGEIAATGQEVLFVITDASDRDLAEQFGAIWADPLSDAPNEAVEEAVFQDGSWTFSEDPGLVARIDASGNAQPPVANPNYSPLKRIAWNGRVVTVNAPFVKWGDEDGQQLIVDRGGCDPLIRRNPPSEFFVGGGPTDGADCSTEAALGRYKGGQVLALDLTAMTVTMKLHKATFDHQAVIPYYTVFEASKAPPAGFMGVIHAPKLGNLGRAGANRAIGRIAQFSNGVRISSAGPNRFQQGIVSYPGGQPGYTPMWHVTWIFFDCDGDGVFFDAEHNRGEGGVPEPAPPETFDPFAMDDKGVSCPGFAAQITGNADGFVETLSQLAELEQAGSVIQTEGPPGLRLNSSLQLPLVVNCPVPLTVRR